MPPPSSLMGKIITQTIAFVGFLVVPAVITLMVPFTDLELRQAEDRATVTVKRYVLMFIPWRTIEISNAKALRVEITPESRYPNTAENRRKDRAGTVKLATGPIVVVGDEREAIVQAAPEIAQGVSDQFKRFLANKVTGPETISVYASWRLSYLLGGAVTALAALYVIGACMAILTFSFNRQRRSR